MFFRRGGRGFTNHNSYRKEVSEIYFNVLAIHSGSMKDIERWKDRETFQLQELGEEAFESGISSIQMGCGHCTIMGSWIVELKCEG